MSTWASLSVQQFWQQFNWDGRPLAPQGSGTVRAGLSLSLGVAQYFALIPWEGQAVVAPVSVPAVTAEPTEELATLEDFLGDVSDFF